MSPHTSRRQNRKPRTRQSIAAALIKTGSRRNGAAVQPLMKGMARRIALAIIEKKFRRIR